MDLGLKDKKIVVSGAANGIGAHTLKRLVDEGAYPIGIDIEPFKGSEVSEYVNENQCKFYQGDASDEKRMREVFEKIPVIHGLVNNAGLLGGDSAHGGRSLGSWYKLMNAHATPAFIINRDMLS